MYLKNIKIDHEQDNLHDALKIDSSLYQKCRERTFFVTLSMFFTLHDLYPDLDDAPRSLRTVTGDLERVIQHVEDEKEYTITLLHFANYHRIAVHAAHRYKDEEKNNKKDKNEDVDSIIRSLVKKIVEKKRAESQEEESDEDRSNAISLESMFDRIEKVKTSKHNFYKYMTLMGYEGYEDDGVNGLLQKALSDK